MAACNVKRPRSNFWVAFILMLIVALLVVAAVVFLRRDEQSEETWLITELLDTEGITRTSYDKALNYIDKEVVLTKNRLLISMEEFSDVSVIEEQMTIERFEFLFHQNAQVLETKQDSIKVKEVDYAIGAPIIFIISTVEGKEYVYMDGWYYKVTRVDKRS